MRVVLVHALVELLVELPTTEDHHQTVVLRALAEGAEVVRALLDRCILEFTTHLVLCEIAERESAISTIVFDCRRVRLLLFRHGGAGVTVVLSSALGQRVQRARECLQKAREYESRIERELSRPTLANWQPLATTGTVLCTAKKEEEEHIIEASETVE